MSCAATQTLASDDDFSLCKVRRGILISGGWTCQNRGDWALGDAALENLRRADYGGPRLLQAFHGEVDWPISESYDPITMWKKTRPQRHKLLSFGFRSLYYRAQKADMRNHLDAARQRLERGGAEGTPVLWITGGGVMNDVASHGPFTSRLGLVAADQGWDVVMTGQTVGPFRTESFRSQFDEFARRCKFLSVRDPDSFEYLSGVHGVGVEPVRSLDDVFTMTPLASNREALCKELYNQLGDRTPHGPFVLFTAHQQGGTDKGIDWTSVFEAVDRVRTMGPEVVVVTFAGHHEVADPEQQRLVAERDGVHFVDHTVTVRGLRLLCAEAELVVTTRFHGQVFAFQAGTPAVCPYSGQYYRSKSFRLMEEWGLAAQALDVSGGWEPLADGVASALEQRDQLAATLATHRPDAVGRLNPMLSSYFTPESGSVSCQ